MGTQTLCEMHHLVHHYHTGGRNPDDIMSLAYCDVQVMCANMKKQQKAKLHLVKWHCVVHISWVVHWTALHSLACKERTSRPNFACVVSHLQIFGCW